MTKGTSITRSAVLRSASRRITVPFGARHSAITPSGMKKRSTGPRSRNARMPATASSTSSTTSTASVSSPI